MQIIREGMRVSIGDLAQGIVEQVDHPIGIAPEMLYPSGCVARMNLPTKGDYAAGFAAKLLSGQSCRLRFNNQWEWNAFAVDASMSWPVSDHSHPLVHFIFSGAPQEVSDGR